MWWWLGCAEFVGSENDKGDEVELPGESSQATPPDTTFVRDVRPLLNDNCVRCHYDGGLGTGDFLDYGTASAWAEIMVDRVLSGEMPPPAADPDCHPYQDADVLDLDPALVPTMQRWIELGKPAGDPATEVPITPWAAAPLTRRDWVGMAAGAVEPQFVDGNEYRCFLLDVPIPADGFITGLEALVDQEPISHHALLFLDPDGGSGALVEDAASQSWPCNSTQPQPEYQLIHAWAPSGGALEFPPDMGIRVSGGTQVVLQMHYFQNGPAVVDQPGYALKLEPTVARELSYLPLGPADFRIPAGDPSYTATLDIPMFWVSFGFVDYDVWGVLPHMHVLGTAYDFYATDADGSEKCISRADDYDFAMQPTYFFDTPVELDADDTLTVSCTWDNSVENPRQINDPPVDVFWGENTQQEMCFGLMYVHIRAAD